MAEEKKTDTSTDSIDATMKATEENLASLRKTMEAIDGLEARWKNVQQKFGEVLSSALSSAFGIAPPCTLTEEEKHSVFNGQPDIAELCKRLREKRYQKIIVMAGAGISVSAGIPDFRSPGTGLYDTLDLEKYQLPSAQALFDISFFRENPKPFYKIRAKGFFSQPYQPTPTHHFIKLLANKQLLHRCYTQNIDGLESKAGIPEDLLMQAHGTIRTATCMNPECKKKYTAAEMEKKVASTNKTDQVPTCDSCTGDNVIKPDIVFFGEDLPRRFKELAEVDFEDCDLLVVMGTSLKVQPFAGLAEKVKQTTPRLLVNKERVGTFSPASEGGYRDILLLDECDKAVWEICRLCQWTTDLEKLVNPVVATKRQGQGRNTSDTTSKTKTASPRPPVATGGSKRPAAGKKVVGSVYQTHSHSHSKRSPTSKKQ